MLYSRSHCTLIVMWVHRNQNKLGTLIQDRATHIYQIVLKHILYIGMSSVMCRNLCHECKGILSINSVQEVATSGCGKREAHILIDWSIVTCKCSTRYWNYLEVLWPCAGGLSAVNAIGAQLRDDPINS